MVDELLLCAEHPYSSFTRPLVLTQEHCEHLSPWVPHGGREHTKAGAGRWVDAPISELLRADDGVGQEAGKGKITELIEEKISFKC